MKSLSREERVLKEARFRRKGEKKSAGLWQSEAAGLLLADPGR